MTFAPEWEAGAAEGPWLALVLNPPAVAIGAPFLDDVSVSMLGNTLRFRGIINVPGGVASATKLADLPAEIPRPTRTRRLFCQASGAGASAAVNVNPNGTITAASTVNEFVALDEKSLVL